MSGINISIATHPEETAIHTHAQEENSQVLHQMTLPRASYIQTLGSVHLTFPIS